ncbi:hypothetical protein MRB53_013974 [Persea americana]|uniref:Uncharacterized protein n=1 Tax=Persea americana TaxID=3435 RepID=A0ACC2KA44_PERAE|nr:hypothetical protein MRB53_013974 [Persea americana]
MLEGAGQATPAQAPVTQSSHVDSMPEVATIARARSPTRIGSSSGHPDQQFFEFGDYVNDPIMKAAVDVKCQKLYRDWKCELHTHYLSLLEEGVPDPKSHPLKPCKADDWAGMIIIYGRLWSGRRSQRKRELAERRCRGIILAALDRS